MSDVREALFDEIMQIIRKNDDTTLNQRVHEIIDVVQAARAQGDAEPDMFWDAENPEYGGGDLGSVIDDMGNNMDLNASEVFEVMCAKKFPNRHVLVKTDADGSIEWEWHWPPQEGE